jgi:hypothetical protein
VGVGSHRARSNSGLRDYFHLKRLEAEHAHSRCVMQCDWDGFGQSKMGPSCRHQVTSNLLCLLIKRHSFTWPFFIRGMLGRFIVFLPPGIDTALDPTNFLSGRFPTMAHLISKLASSRCTKELGDGKSTTEGTYSWASLATDSTSNGTLPVTVQRSKCEVDVSHEKSVTSWTGRRESLCLTHDYVTSFR